jgi:hypothetical protein|tara:strand:+ start:1337 stop:1735 length:399 start_codon:yes stop_codon:yes gene_type:complete
MSKFLEGVEEHTPDKDIDAVTKAKRNVQRIFMKAGYTADAKVFRDDITLTLEDGTKVVLEIKSAVKPEVEDGEMEQEKLDTLTKTLALSDAVTSKDTKVGFLQKDGKKSVAKAKNKIYNKMAKQLNAIAREI